MIGAQSKEERRAGMLRRFDALVDKSFVAEKIVPLLNGPAPLDWSAELARAKGTRLTIRYTFAGVAALYAKAYRGKLGPRAYTALRALWDQGFQEEHRVPEPVGFLADENLLLMRPARGMPLGRVFLRAPLEEALRSARAAAGWLARLHSSSIPLLAVQPSGERLRILKECDALVKAAAAAPAYSAVLLDFLRLVRDQAPASKLTPRLTPIHGQFTPNNVYVDGACVTVIDLDTACISDPADDVARFVSKITWPTLAASCPLDRAERIAGEFLAEYQKQAEADLGNFRYYRSLYSLKELSKLAMDTAADGPAFLRAQEYCRIEVQCRCPRYPHHPQALAGATARLIDPAFISEEIGRLACIAADPGQCRAAIVRNEGTGRITIRYQLGPEATLYAKQYGDVRPRRNRVLSALWEAGFDAGSRYRVPAPLGYLPEHNLLVMSAVPGATLSLCRNGEGLVCHGAREAARWLAALHRSSVRVGRPEADWDSLRLFRIAERLVQSAAANPGQGSWLLELLYWLKHKLETLPEPRPVVQTHGSYHLSHIFFAPGVTSVIDLDRSRPADPAKDVAEFLGALCSDAAAAGWAVASLDRAVSTFLDEYAAAAPVLSPGLPHYCAAYLALHLLRTARDDGPGGPGWAGLFEFYQRQLQQVVDRCEVDRSDWEGMKQ